MQIVILKYQAGNLFSVRQALIRLGHQATISDDPEEIRQADKVIFPGVGQASAAMKSLRESGLDQLIPSLKQPVLGICLGMQLLLEESEEEDTPCLGIIPGAIRKFPVERDLKIPHMGWNRITNGEGPLFWGVDPQAWYYFVHSYYAGLLPETMAEAAYGIPFSAALQKDNFFGCQFHPEKSGPAGAQILKNFLAL